MRFLSNLKASSKEATHFLCSLPIYSIDLSERNFSKSWFNVHLMFWIYWSVLFFALDQNRVLSDLCSYDYTLTGFTYAQLILLEKQIAIANRVPAISGLPQESRFMTVYIRFIPNCLIVGPAVNENDVPYWIALVGNLPIVLVSQRGLINISRHLPYCTPQQPRISRRRQQLTRQFTMDIIHAAVVCKIE